jgi:hypothetical protein
MLGVSRIRNCRGFTDSGGMIVSRIKVRTRRAVLRLERGAQLKRRLVS